MGKAGNNLLTSGNLKVTYIAVLLAAAALYTITCAPGPLWQDSGMYQYRIWHNDIEGRLGLALSHPLYHIIGIGVKYIPVGEFAYRINLISAIAAAFTIANLFLLLRLWLNKNLPALIAAVTLALSHTLWRHAVIAEDYTLYTALLSSELLMLLQYVKTKRTVFLYLLGLFNGLAIANHMWAVIALVCYLVFLTALLVRKQISLRHFGIIVGLWVVGAAPYEYLIINKYIETGDFTSTLASAIFGKSWQADVLNIRLSTRLVRENLILLAYNFPTPNVIFFFAGLYGLKKVSPSRSFRNILLALLILFFVFAFRYTVPDRYAFFIPFYCLASILIGIGFNFLVNQLARKTLTCLVFALALLPIPTYIIAPVIAQKVGFNISTRGDIPYRNDYTWFLQPWRTGYRGPEEFAGKVFSTVEADAVVYADNTTVYPLLYVQEVKAERTDIKIISGIASSQGAPTLGEKTIEQWLSEKSIYSVSPLSEYKLEEAGIIWKVVD